MDEDEEVEEEDEDEDEEEEVDNLAVEVELLLDGDDDRGVLRTAKFLCADSETEGVEEEDVDELDVKDLVFPFTLAVEEDEKVVDDDEFRGLGRFLGAFKPTEAGRAFGIWSNFFSDVTVEGVDEVADGATLRATCDETEVE